MFQLNEVLTLNDPATSWRWRVTAFDTPAGLEPPPLHYFHAIPVPYPSIESVQVHLQASNAFFVPGFQAMGTLSITLYEDEFFDTTLWLQAWRQRIRGTDGLYEIPVPMGNIEITCYNTRGKGTLRQTLKKVWPVSQSPSELSYDNGGRLVITAEFAIHDVVTKPLFPASAPPIERMAVETTPLPSIG